MFLQYNYRICADSKSPLWSLSQTEFSSPQVNRWQIPCPTVAEVQSCPADHRLTEVSTIFGPLSVQQGVPLQTTANNDIQELDENNDVTRFPL